MRKHRGELDIDEDIQLESTNWKVQRVAWVVMAIFVLAALLGFTGKITIIPKEQEQKEIQKV